MLELKYKVVLFIFIILYSSCTSQQIEENDYLSVCFTGDVLLDRGVRQQIEKKGISYLFEDVKPLFQQSDAVVINLECPATKTIAPINKKYIFRAEPEWLSTLRESGITHAALANNHSMDQGRVGLSETSRNLIDNQILPIGYGENKHEACIPVFLKKNNIEVAIFNSVTLPLENWVSLDEECGVCQMSVDALSKEVRKLKKEKPTCYIVVVLHWGMEFQLVPALMQRKEGHKLIDAGADAIIGHHPHVIQQEEIFQDKPIFYSLGNFVFDQKMPDTRKGLIVELHFGKNNISFKKHQVIIDNAKPFLQK